MPQTRHQPKARHFKLTVTYDGTDYAGWQLQQNGKTVQEIVEGAVGMVEMALARLSANKVVELDEERKAAMVSNLLVVLCSERSVQPVVNAGTLYH